MRLPTNTLLLNITLGPSYARIVTSTSRTLFTSSSILLTLRKPSYAKVTMFFAAL